jgi:hypothetical protein
MNTSTKPTEKLAECGNKSKPLLVAGFPGTGKTSYCYRDADYMPQGFATDSDSSKFDKANFPQNYIEHIKQKILEGYARVFISSHKDVRDALVLHNLPFVLIYPSKELKQEYIERYKQRGNNEKFIQLVSDNWENWIDDCKVQTGCFHIELKSGQFVANVV